MTPQEILGVIVGIITIAGALVAVTRHVTQLQSKVREERLEAAKEATESKLRDIEAELEYASSQLLESRRRGQAALSEKWAVDDELASLMQAVGARAGSVYVPVRTGSAGEAIGLAFVSIQPFGHQAATLKHKVIPIHSLAGRCFSTGVASVRSNAQHDPEHYEKADRLSGYETQDTLNIPIKHKGETVGVLQLLNKRSQTGFEARDLDDVEALMNRLPAQVSRFLRNPQSLEILGVRSDQEAQTATVLFVDLTRSSDMFRELNTAVAIGYLNEYFEAICDVAFRHGATVDKYLGDGVIFRFNVPRPVANHVTGAAAASLEMLERFKQLKAGWLAGGDPLDQVYIRCSLSSGLVYQAEVGHPQYRYLTLFGIPVNVAANLTDVSRRDANVVLIDEAVRSKLGTNAQLVQVPRDRLGKASAYISDAFELQAL